MEQGKEEHPRPNDDGAADDGAADHGATHEGAAAPAGHTDESIGRPAEWREGRYQRGGARVDQSVKTPPATSPVNRPKSPPAGQQKPVTLRDYEG